MEIDKPGFIYFIRQGAAGPVKIGWATNPRARAATLQTGNPTKLTIIGLVAASEPDELVWHARFAADRIAGEWFRHTPELARAIKEARTHKSPVMRRNARRPMPDLTFDELRGAMEASEAEIARLSPIDPLNVEEGL